MKELVTALLVFVSVVLVISILLQNKSGGVGTVFGGFSGGETYRSKRGLEKIVQNVSIIFSLLFVFLCILFFLI